jgi:5-hydroxyisourate hydrolase
MSGITTHVLDMSRGLPAAGAPVRLEMRLPDGGWTALGNAITNADGRASLAADGIAAGVYRITFDTGAYLPDGLYPEVAVTFHVRDLSRHYHIPLLLGPYGYTTYRGS